jgi:hypothetical protein
MYSYISKIASIFKKEVVISYLTSNIHAIISTFHDTFREGAGEGVIEISKQTDTKIYIVA